MTLHNSVADRPDSKVASILIIAAWFGLVTGLVEGIGLLVAQTLGWFEWYRSLTGVWIEIIWISAVFDLFLFGAVGLVLAVIARVFPRFPIIRFAVFLFAFMAFVDWLALTGRIFSYACVTLAAGLATVLIRWFRKREAAILRFWRWSLPYVAGVAILALVGIQTGLWARERLAIARLPQASSASPNILLIVVDTLRADHLSSYGYPRNTSPNIDRIGRRGVVFENAFAASSWTPPSHASLFTGRYPYEHQVEWYKDFDGRYPTLGDVLQSRGYRTGAFSGNTLWFSRRWGFGQGFIRFDDYFYSIASMIVRTVYGYNLLKYGILRRLGIDEEVREEQRKKAYVINRVAINWIKRDPGSPFLAVLNYMDAHEPYDPPEPYRSRYSKVTDLRNGASVRQVTPQAQSEIDAYDGEISYVDDHIGKLVTELEKLGLTKNTLIIITSDHGQSFGEHGLFGHGNALYHETLHVPLIFSWPGHVPVGIRVASPVSNAAIPATVMEFIGDPMQKSFPGPSLVKLWEKPEADSERTFPLAELAQRPFEDAKAFPVYHGWMKSLVSPEWHYIMHQKFGAELYDRRNDPKEGRNLAAQPELQEVIKQLRSQLDRTLDGSSDRVRKPDPSRP